ncbi:MAG: YceD family protein [Candidatus Aminicenantes bacterium]
MIIDVDRLPKNGLKICRDFEFFSTDLVEESAVFLEPVYAELTVKKVDEEISVKGRIKIRLSFICSRCLVPYEFPVDSSFDLVYLPEEFDEIKEELDSEDINRLFYYSRKIDIHRVVLEQMNLTFPVKPLCSKDCPGICPVCGKIIKNGQCSCVRSDSDPRLEKLKIFIRDKR